MKRKTILPIFLLLLVLIISLIIYLFPSTESFHISSYQEQIASFSSNNSVSEIDSAREAINCSKKLWKSEFGENYDNIGLLFRPIKVFYDSTSDCWLVKYEYSNETDLCEVVPMAIIQGDGQVLAVFMN